MTRRRVYRRPVVFGGTERRRKRLRFHLIEADELMSSLEYPSKFNTGASFISMLREAGRGYTGAWLKSNLRNLGKRSSVDLERTFT